MVIGASVVKVKVIYVLKVQIVNAFSVAILLTAIHFVVVSYILLKAGIDELSRVFDRAGGEKISVWGNIHP